MGAKSRKRLVGRWRYMGVKSAQGVGYGFAYSLGCSGFLWCALTIVFIIMIGHDARRPHEQLADLVVAILCAVAGLATKLVSEKVVDRVEQIEEVELLTPEKVSRLTAEEVLVRPSDLPPSQQKSELLRSAQSGLETRPEELLRAQQKPE